MAICGDNDVWKWLWQLQRLIPMKLEEVAVQYLA